MFPLRICISTYYGYTQIGRGLKMKKVVQIAFCLISTAASLSYVSSAKADILADTFARLTGPVAAGIQYSDLYGAILRGQLTQGFTSNQAASLEAEYGLENHRANLGWGYALTPNQRFKIAAEHLAQFMEFNFSSGDASRWISQNAIGGSYQYLIPSSFINDINANLDYSKAISNNLPARSSNSSTVQRHAAGANNTGGGIGVDITPTYGTLVGAQLNYDDVKYEVRYEGDDENDGLGFTLTLQQLLTKHVKLNLLASSRTPYQDYQGGVSWLLNTHSNDRAEWAFNVERIIGKSAYNYDDTRLGLDFIYAWDASDSEATSGYNLVSNDLNNWVSQPAVYLKQVLARKDQG